MKCYIRDLMSANQRKIEYTKPIYTKLHSIYGYISLNINTVRHERWIDTNYRKG